MAGDVSPVAMLLCTDGPVVPLTSLGFNGFDAALLSVQQQQTSLRVLSASDTKSSFLFCQAEHYQIQIKHRGR